MMTRRGRRLPFVLLGLAVLAVSCLAHVPAIAQQVHPQPAPSRERLAPVDVGDIAAEFAAKEVLVVVDFIEAINKVRCVTPAALADWALKYSQLRAQIRDDHLAALKQIGATIDNDQWSRSVDPTSTEAWKDINATARETYSAIKGAFGSLLNKPKCPVTPPPPPPPPQPQPQPQPVPTPVPSTGLPPPVTVTHRTTSCAPCQPIADKLN